MVNIILKELIIKKLPVNQEYRFCFKAYRDILKMNKRHHVLTMKPVKASGLILCKNMSAPIGFVLFYQER